VTTSSDAYRAAGFDDWESRSRRAAALKMLGMTANHVTSFNNEEAFDATY
jgi:hypothetical protein